VTEGIIDQMGAEHVLLPYSSSNHLHADIESFIEFLLKLDQSSFPRKRESSLSRPSGFPLSRE
ncbi:MAG: hypothetical protein WCH07_03970, partial [Deltaproteobacteria bacterium]